MVRAQVLRVQNFSKEKKKLMPIFKATISLSSRLTTLGQSKINAFFWLRQLNVMSLSPPVFKSESKHFVQKKKVKNDHYLRDYKYLKKL